MIVTAIIISIIITSLEQHDEVAPPKETITNQIIRLSEITLPDSFSLMLSEHQGLIIHWQADSTSATELWSLTSAKGETTCQNITFNKGDKIRTTSVIVENNTEYYANFSPLDTKALIHAIAFRGNFSLCDYKFSLKGSQAVLGKHNDYAEFIDY